MYPDVATGNGGSSQRNQGDKYSVNAHAQFAWMMRRRQQKKCAQYDHSNPLKDAQRTRFKTLVKLRVKRVGDQSGADDGGGEIKVPV